MNIKSSLDKIKKILFRKENVDVETLNDINVDTNAVSSDTFKKENLSEQDLLATKAAKDEITKIKNRKRILFKKIIIVVAIIVFVIFAILLINNINKSNAKKADILKNVTTAKIMNIQSEISGSGTLEPKDSYTITSLVEGNVTNVFFNEGDNVVKDQLLLTIDSNISYRNIMTASSSLTQAKDTYEQAKYEYEKIMSDYDGKTYKAKFSGSLREFKVKKGDELKNNTEVGTIINDSIMNIKVPFISSEARRIYVGEGATLELQETGELIPATVKSIAEESQAIDSGALVRYVTIKCQNPGGLTENNTAIAYIDGLTSIEDSNFYFETNEKISFEDGNNIVVDNLLVEEGAYVEKGTPLFSITSDTFNNVITNKKKTYLQAKENLTKAENSYKDSIDAYDEYFITAPINGTVIQKDAKVGDKIQKGNNNVKTLAMIYDLSELTFKMNIDELDISKIKEGQEVNVQADAFKNKMFKGIITNISLVSENSNGVTNYPVTVSIFDTGKLLPGMNVDGYVILAKSDNTLAIPVDALQRGNVVYVKNTSKTIKSKTYNDEGINDRIKNRVPDGFTAVNVETGISNANFIEILSGLSDGDEIYVSQINSNQNQFRMNGMPMGGMGGMGGMNGGRR